MIELTQNTLERIKLLFCADEVELVATILREECADNLPLQNPSTPEGLERIRFAVLKLSQGQLDKLRETICEAQIDKRDVLVAAGFGDDTLAHSQWLPGDN